MRVLSISETGRRAYEAGQPANANPFAIGSQARSLWAKGFRAARNEAKIAAGKGQQKEGQQ